MKSPATTVQPAVTTEARSPMQWFLNLHKEIGAVGTQCVQLERDPLANPLAYRKELDNLIATARAAIADFDQTTGALYQ
jgi:hypothetical protein